MTKFSSLTWAQAEAQVRRLATADRQNPPETNFREMANIFLSYLWRILDGKHDWAYRKQHNLVVAADVDFLQKAAITALELDITKPVQYIRASAFVFRTGDRLYMEGISQETTDLLGFRAMVVEGGLTAILKDIEINDPLASAVIPTLADWNAGAGLIVEHSHAPTVADLSSLSLKRLVGVTDKAGVRVWDVVTDYGHFRELVRDPAYDDQVACYLRGDVLEIFKGLTAAALDQPVLEYDGVPEAYTEASRNNTIQLFEEYYVMWQDLMVGWVHDFNKTPKEPGLEARIDAHLQMINRAMQAGALESGMRERSPIGAP